MDIMTKDPTKSARVTRIMSRVGVGDPCFSVEISVENGLMVTVVCDGGWNMNCHGNCHGVNKEVFLY